MEVDIVIVNWNSGDFLKKCFDSLFKEVNLQHIKNIYLVDNDSSDHSLNNLPDSEKLVLVRNKKNIGFSKACNQGFRLCASPYVLLLNPDTQLYSSTIESCIEFMNLQNNVDVMGCQLVNDDQEVSKSCARFPTPLRMCFESIGLSKIAPHIFTPASLMTDWDHKESRVVDQVMGAFMFMRKSVFERVGYFDERFFVYYEELDFSKRLANSGGKSYYNKDIKAIHSGAGTTRDVKGFRLFLNLRSRLQYAKKHFHFFGYIIVWLSTFIIEPFSRSIFLLFKGELKEIADVIKGYKLLGASLPISDKQQF